MGKAMRQMVDRGIIRSRIRQAGLRATTGRVATYAAVAAAGRPLTHADVVAQLDELELDRATIYRKLMDLTEAGILNRKDLGTNWHFELAAEHDGDHAHFVCTDCGDVQCLEDVDVQFKRKGGMPSAVAREAYDLQLRGRCDSCS